MTLEEKRKYNRERMRRERSDPIKKALHLQKYREWSKQNSEYTKQRNRENYLKNPLYFWEWRKKNPESCRQSARKWKKNNREKVRQTRREYDKKQMASNVQFRLTELYRKRVSRALRKGSILKSGPTLSLLGCSVKELQNHLESRFVTGMTWENYGSVWHVDHIRPCASFDLSNSEQQKQCFHFSNLQPLFAADNLKKGAKWI